MEETSDYTRYCRTDLKEKSAYIWLECTIVDMPIPLPVHFHGDLQASCRGSLRGHMHLLALHSLQLLPGNVIRTFIFTAKEFFHENIMANFCQWRLSLSTFRIGAPFISLRGIYHWERMLPCKSWLMSLQSNQARQVWMKEHLLLGFILVLF